MPSPCPGMDPYHEGSLWMTVHTTLAVEIARQLNRQLLPRYIALTTRRYVMDTPEESEILIGGTYPDIAVVKQGPVEEGRGTVAIIAPPLQMATLIRTPVPHITVETRAIAQRQLVTVLQ